MEKARTESRLWDKVKDEGKRPSPKGRRAIDEGLSFIASEGGKLHRTAIVLFRFPCYTKKVYKKYGRKENSVKKTGIED